MGVIILPEAPRSSPFPISSPVEVINTPSVHQLEFCAGGEKL